LTQNDEKCYWGDITWPEDASWEGNDGAPAWRDDRKIEIEGSVTIGCGLEPCPVGRFRMIEIGDEVSGEDDEADEEEEDEEMSANAATENAIHLDSMLVGDDSDVEDGLDSFDVAGAFQ